ncbi:MAG: APC family permease [Desulfobacteraceae bacterium]|jgi:amino acid transporter
MTISIPLIAIAMGLLLSPGSLTILGNSMGIAGAPFLLAILTGLVVHLFTALGFGELSLHFSGPDGEARLFKESMGPTPALVLPLCSRILFTLCAATGIFATAGYAFNEIFILWFPNLGFSFCLLGFLLLINCLGHRVSNKAQIVFAAMTVLGLLTLSIVGLFHLGEAPPAFEASNPAPLHPGRAIPFALVLFVGFDLAFFARGNNVRHSMNLIRSMILGILLAATILALWGLVSLKYVSPGKLTDTSIPHMIAARIIMGESGRFIMGLVVLAGSCAAVNALLMGVSEMISGMAKQGLLPAFLSMRPKRVPIGLILLVLGIAIMMATGMAGKPELETYTKAAIWFWLLHYAMMHVSFLILRWRNPGRFHPLQIHASPVIPIVSALTLLMGLAALLWTAPEGAPLLKSVLVVLFTVSISGFFLIRMTRRRGKPASSKSHV